MIGQKTQGVGIQVERVVHPYGSDGAVFYWRVSSNTETVATGANSTWAAAVDCAQEAATGYVLKRGLFS